MKAITIYQPWASLAALAEKKLETRSWCTKYRGPLAIHSGKKIKTGMCDQASLRNCLERLGNIKYPLGAVLAISNLIDCVEITPAFTANLSDKELAFGDYTSGRFAWVLEDTHQLATPIPARGMQRLWNFNETPHLVAIDPWVIGSTKIWPPRGIQSGKRVDPGREDAVMGLEVA